MLAPFKPSASLIAAVAGLLAAGTARADDHLDQLAARLQRQVSALHREVDAHARGFPQYAHLHRYVTEMERLADHLHDVAHRPGRPGHLRADVRRLDKLVHHVEDLVENLARSGRLDRRTVGHPRRAVEQVSDTVHHLADDLN